MVESKDSRFAGTLDGGDVELTVTIGNRQIGGSAIKIGDAQLEPVGDVTDHRIGSATELDGKSLLVRTLVSDVNLASDWTSVRYYLTGVTPQEYSAKHEVAEDGNAVLYTTTFTFSS